eukprot:734289-Alexandrium_andersonii.AAC.1
MEELERRHGVELFAKLVAGCSLSGLKEWRLARGVASEKLLRKWPHAVLARARRVDSVLGDRLRGLGAVPVEALRAEREQAGVEESCGLLRLWRRRQAIALHLEVEFGEELRAALAAGRWRGR